MSRVRFYLTHLLPALQRIEKRPRSSQTQRQRAIRFAADMCLARTATSQGSAWARALNLRLMRTEKTIRTMKMKKCSSRRKRGIAALARRMTLASLSSRCCNNVNVKTGNHDSGFIDRRLGVLQRLVPGGKNMGLDTLFQETADYILNLQMQVQAMEVLTDFCTTKTPAGIIGQSITQQQQGSAFLSAQM